MAIESKMRRPVGFGSPQESSSSRAWRAVAAMAVLAALAALAWYGWSSRGEPSVPSGTYQAVFLDNGQTYFGKLRWDEPRKEYVRLSEVYYLDFRQNPQDPSVSSSDLKLTKLGGEVHGPEDYMDIHSEHILYVEDLRGDSKIVQAISEYAAKSNP